MMPEEREATINFLIGSLLCVGILASYIPQHVECMQLRSSQGLSLWTVLIASVSCTAATLSSLLGDWHTIKAIALSRDGTSLCLRIVQIANASMPTFQNLITVVVGTPTYALYYFWFGHLEIEIAGSPNRLQRCCAWSLSMHRLEVTVTAITWLFIAFAVSGSVWVLATFDSISPSLALLSKSWGILAAVTNTIQWIPQIDATWKAQHEGVLSAASLIISVFADFLVAAFWIVGPRESLWIYMSLATDAFLQILLTGMIFFFRCKRRQLETERGIVCDNSLSDPLLLPDSSSELHDNIHSEAIECIMCDGNH